jgi:hypothetical protein
MQKPKFGERRSRNWLASQGGVHDFWILARMLYYLVMGFGWKLCYARIILDANSRVMHYIKKRIEMYKQFIRLLCSF